MSDKLSPESGQAPADLVELGRVVGSYGVRGWIKVEPFNAQSDVLLHARQWWVRRQPDAAPLAWRIVQARTQGATVVAEVRGLTVREQAAAWKGAHVLVARSAFPSPDDDEYYWVDLIDCLVSGEDDDGRVVVLGRVREVSDNGAHAVLHLARTSEQGEPLLDARGREQSLLVPFVAAHVLQVDLAARRIVTNWPPDV